MPLGYRFQSFRWRKATGSPTPRPKRRWAAVFPSMAARRGMAKATAKTAR
jgi:hypothetical protein